MSPTPQAPIRFARLSGGIVVIRISGKGTHLQSPALRRAFELTRGDNPPPRYIVDLDECTTMDSTFMGTLAIVGLWQRETHGTNVVVTNISEHVRYLLNTLGLKYLLDLRKDTPEAAPLDRDSFESADAPELSMLDRIVMMVEAHERLIDVDSKNEVKFEGVLENLRQSLEREKDRPH